MGVGRVLGVLVSHYSRIYAFLIKRVARQSISKNGSTRVHSRLVDVYTLFMILLQQRGSHLFFDWAGPTRRSVVWVNIRHLQMAEYVSLAEGPGRFESLDRCHCSGTGDSVRGRFSLGFSTSWGVIFLTALLCF